MKPVPIPEPRIGRCEWMRRCCRDDNVTLLHVCTTYDVMLWKNQDQLASWELSTNITERLFSSCLEDLQRDWIERRIKIDVADVEGT